MVSLSRKNYEGLKKQEILMLIKKHETALKILKTLLGELRGEEERAKHESFHYIDIINSSLGFKTDFYKNEAKLLVEKYIEDGWKTGHSRISIEALATAAVLAVLNHYSVAHVLSEVNVFNVPEASLKRLSQKLKEFGEEHIWQKF